MVRERVENRMLCAEIVNVRWKDKSGRGRRGAAILEDISPSGACLQLEAPVPPNTILHVVHRKARLQGVVRYCVYRDIGYYVGLHFTADSKWSRARFRPDHLLDVHKLMRRAIRGTASRLEHTTIQ
jgi:PilZ domain